MADDNSCCYSPRWYPTTSVGRRGEALACEHKAYVYANGDVAWEVDRVQAVLTRNHKKARVCKEIRMREASWEAYLQALGFRFKDQVFISVRQCKVRGEPPNVRSREKMTATTVGMIAYIVSLISECRSRKHKEDSKTLLHDWLAHLVSHDLQAHAVVHGAVDACKRRCHDRVDSSGRCVHLRELPHNALNEHGESTVQQVVVDALVFGFERSFVCDACKRFGFSVVSKFSDIINAKFRELRLSSDPMNHVPEAKHGRRKKFDEDYKRKLVETLRRKRKVKTGAGAVAAQDVAGKRLRMWGQEQVRAHQAACARIFGTVASGVFSLKEDACRVGSPKEEALIGILKAHDLDVTTYLFNQAQCCQTLELPNDM